jgi:hypothetical protein
LDEACSCTRGAAGSIKGAATFEYSSIDSSETSETSDSYETSESPESSDSYESSESEAGSSISRAGASTTSYGIAARLDYFGQLAFYSQGLESDSPPHIIAVEIEAIAYAPR